MRFQFVPDESEEKDVNVVVTECVLCRSSHTSPLFYTEVPIRVKSDHTTYNFRIECPASNRFILIEDWRARPLNIWVCVGPSSDLIPHIEKPARARRANAAT